MFAVNKAAPETGPSAPTPKPPSAPNQPLGRLNHNARASFETRAPVTNIAIPLCAGQANGLHSLEPGLWAALNQKSSG